MGFSLFFKTTEEGAPVRDSLEASREARWEDPDRLRTFCGSEWCLVSLFALTRYMNSVVLRRCWEQVYVTRIDYNNKTVDQRV